MIGGAKPYLEKVVIKNIRLFIKRLNKKGPSKEPSGTPVIIFFF